MPNYKCNHCDYSTEDKSRFTKHATTHIPRTRKCKLCPRTFRFRDDLQKHVDKQHGSYSCTFCDKTFSSATKRDNHIRYSNNCKQGFEMISFLVKFIHMALISLHVANVERILLYKRNLSFM